MNQNPVMPLRQYVEAAQQYKDRFPEEISILEYSLSLVEEAVTILETKTRGDK